MKADCSKTSHCLVIGLTGLPSAGKGEAAAALVEMARRHGWRAERLVFSDQIKEEARARGIPEAQFSRDLLAAIGSEMREHEGPGVLARRIARKIQSSCQDRPRLFITDGLRHPGEYTELKNAFGDNFVLVAVEAEPDEIIRRLWSRGRTDESPDVMRSREKAIELLERELRGGASSGAPNVGECMKLATIKLPNNGTLNDLKEAVEKLFQSLVARFGPTV